jgi:4-amino-4-deoxy-L-arabinose transferase-like glycosyltransferase
MTRLGVFGIFVAFCVVLTIALPAQSGQVIFYSILIAAMVAALFAAARQPVAADAKRFQQAGQTPAYKNIPNPNVRRFAGGLGIKAQNIQWGNLASYMLGLVMMYLGQLQIYQDGLHGPISGGWVIFLVGVITFYITLDGNFPPFFGPIAEAPSQTIIRRLNFRPQWFAASIGLAAFVSWRSVVKPQEAYLYEHLLLWLLCMATLILAFAPNKQQPRFPNNHPLRDFEVLLVFGIFVAAFLIRGTNLGGNPNMLDQDEAIFALEGATFPKEMFLITPFEPGNHSHPRMYQAMIGVSNVLFGYTLEAARYPSAILGALGVVALFLLGRELFGWQYGLVAALFMLPWFFHVQLSRLSMNQPGDPLFATLSFYFLLRGLRRQAATDFVLCGIMLGCAQLFYLGGRLAIPIMVAYLIFLLITQHKLVMGQWRNLFIVPLAAFIVTLPQNHYLYYFRQPLSTRAEPNILLNGQLSNAIETGNFASYFGDQVRYSFLALFQVLDLSGWIGRSSNMMGIFGGPLLLLGVLATLILMWRRPRWALPLGWVFSVILLGSTFSISPPQYQRYFPAVSGMALLVAIGAMVVAYGLAHTINKPGWGKSLGVFLGLLLFAGNAWFYYGVYVPDHLFLQNRPNMATNAISRVMVQASNIGKQVILVPEFGSGVDNTLVVQYFMMGRQYIRYDAPEMIANFRAQKPFIFIIGANKREELFTVMRNFPGGKLSQHFLPDKTLGFWIYEKG